MFGARRNTPSVRQKVTRGRRQSCVKCKRRLSAPLSSHGQLAEEKGVRTAVLTKCSRPPARLPARRRRAFSHIGPCVSEAVPRFLARLHRRPLFVVRAAVIRVKVTQRLHTRSFRWYRNRRVSPMLFSTCSSPLLFSLYCLLFG